MKAQTAALLLFADATFEGGRDELLKDLIPLLADKKFFSPEKVAERYDVSLSTVKVWRRDGKLTPSLKIPGGTARYTLSDLEKFELATGRKEAAEQA